jgi:hypothetical protein
MTARRYLDLAWLVIAALPTGCAEMPPDDVLRYQVDCIPMNAEPIPVYDGDPHQGTKNVFACQVPRAQLETNARPFPDGALIVKEARRAGDDFAWLVAAARKQGGTWRWDEYTRNFADEELRHIPSGEGVCTGCHQAARSSDWIFTQYEPTEEARESRLESMAAVGPPGQFNTASAGSATQRTAAR